MRGAETWEERRQRKAEVNPERRIASHYLPAGKELGGEHAPPDGEATIPGKETAE